MKHLLGLMEKSRTSSWYRFWFNAVLNRGIPFNRRHGYRVISIDEGCVVCQLPYRTLNLNHIKGIHACAIATVAEFAAGLLLLQSFSPERFRLIMSKLEVEYHYQAKMDIKATASMEIESIKQLKNQLNQQEAVLKKVVTQVHDKENNLIATVNTTWQLKAWDKVKLKTLC